MMKGEGKKAIVRYFEETQEARINWHTRLVSRQMQLCLIEEDF